MHDCSETKEQITELLLDGADCRSDEVLSAELRGCVECRNEFEALNATLRITARSKKISAPAEDYWTTYHAKLRHKLSNINALSQRPSLVERFFRFSIPVPAPVALVLIVACVIFALVGLRTARTQRPQTPSVVQVPVEVRVEVPVIKEKIVTRVVYRKTPPTARTIEPKVEGTFAKFKPTDEVKLTVIKGGSPYEK